MADAARSARAAALEEKKRRLEEMKKRRTQRTATATETTTARTNASSNLDEYIDGLLSEPSATSKATAAAPTAEAAETKPEAAELPNNVGAEPAPAPNEAPPPASYAPPVKKVETFEISTQTEKEDFPETEQEEEPEAAEEKPPEDADNKDDANEKETEALLDPKVLSQEEREEAIASIPFSSFINTASKKVERVLGAPVLADLLVNYVGETDKDAVAAETSMDASKYIAASQVYECAKWTASRDVTDMDWSPHQREVMLSSYHMPNSLGSSSSSAAISVVSPDDTPSASLAPRSGELLSDGLVLVWSLPLTTRPEHIFVCGSPVSTARFHPTEAHLILGGCQSGQWVLWDVRAGRLPVQRSPSSQLHPICSMELTDGSDMVTASTDGKVQVWSLANLQEPAQKLQVENANLSSMAVSTNNTLLCGSEHGGIFVVPTSSTGSGGTGARSSKRAVRQLDDSGSGHFGMVTAVSTRSINNEKQEFLLSSGVDWTCKLWAPSVRPTPLLTWTNPSYDYLCDVQWSPTHPSVFVTASSNGKIAFWNLALSLEESLGTVDIGSSKNAGANKVKFSADGRRLMVAAADKVHVLNLSEDILRQKGDEESKLIHNLSARGLLASNTSKGTK